MLLLLLVTPAVGQSPESFGETLEVHLVNLEVSVESFLVGTPIMDLEREDFEVFEDGIRRPITHFERVLAGRSKTSVDPSVELTTLDDNSAPEASQVLQYTVLAFDGGSLSHLRLQRAIRDVREFVLGNTATNTRWAVVILGSNPQVLLPFTSDPRRVAAALDSLKGLWRGVPVAGWGGAGTFLGGEEVAPEAPLPTESEKREDLQSVETLKENLQTNLARFRERGLAASLSELLRGWASLEGSKSLVIFYEPLLMPTHDNSENFQEVVKWAGTAGFTLHSTDVRGLNNPAIGGGPALGLSLHKTLAVATGGRSLALNDLSRILELASESAANHYRIGFQVDRAADGLAHEIEVKVRRPGWIRIRHSPRYLDLAPRERLVRQLRTSSNIPKSVDGRLPLSIEVHVAPVVAGSGAMPVTAMALVPGDRLGLLTEEDGRSGEVEFFITIYGESGNLLEIDSEVQPVSTRNRLPGRLVQVFTANLTPGNYTVAMAALDTVDGTVGMTYTLIHP
ncbi:MAG: VWA domain-containing protein [Thermoanaerobaculia bacterium]|nr:VWA domain-containing protein [Thermoanaerobaculia bacterium]